ncbi:hypothetical protein A1F97_03973 [Pyrenophora tritici-repentis]|nr:hypothetical protein A1F99_055710 [Pyrenophora tritici-repentis]KAI1532800.1 hypothetical protein PtrSN001C_007831 [Pyrenophora tritici-repentis]KAI1570583.1 hypothetical protein PtrEW7m1_008159 [Pyrenophora tritici-repentis]KAI1598685.1 hypothetical protein PtrCC142_007967 [Pyrenophora tritici-repentis]KAI1671657.1 hypothetical protein L13192_05014 [Pyrenophora tritici-repentis]
MAPTQPAVPQRSVSFNPEAATFSPSSVNPTTTTADTDPTPPKVQEHSRVPDMFGEKWRFRSSRRGRANRRRYQGARIAYPLRSTTRTLEGVQQDAAPRDTLPKDNINIPMPFPPLGLLCSARRGPDFSAPPVGELNANLGLSGAKRTDTTNDSPVQSHELPGSDADALAGLDGKLIGQALNKPMTANDLARYLNGLTVHQGGLIPPSQGTQYGYGTRLPEIEASEDKATKIVKPPPGFGRVQSRRIPAGESGAAVLSVMDPQNVPTGPAAMTRPRRFSDLPQFPQHASGSGHRRRSRAYTRGKRTDQGPEPSAADIYPEDANVTRRSSYLQPAVPFLFPKAEPLPQSHFSAEDPVSWPTPAEVDTLNLKKPQTPRSLIRLFDQKFGNEAAAAALPAPPAPFDIFADHSYPTKDDFNAADDEVRFLLSSIPTFYYQQEVGQAQTQTQHQDQGTAYLTCDTRPLTPEQLTGARYGIRYHGIGLGDNWKCLEVKEGEPFRVRPRNHDGWGSWEWAIRKGWAKE